MQRRTFVSTMVATASTVAMAPRLAAQSSPSPAPAGAPITGYAPVNGLELYYEVHGTGEPMVLLHGAYAMTDLWRPMVEALAATRQVIALDFQGHGRTADIDRPFTYEQFADDVAALMAHLEVAQTDIAGYSMGGMTALQVAIRHPDLVRKLIPISAAFRFDGVYPEILEVAKTIPPEAFAGSPPEEAYLRVAPNPEDWPVLFERMHALESIEYVWSEADIRAIEAPTLLIFADTDNTTLPHMIELFELLGGGVPGDLTGLPKAQLAIVPGATHVSLVFERGAELVALIERFLALPMPEAQ